MKDIDIKCNKERMNRVFKNPSLICIIFLILVLVGRLLVDDVIKEREFHNDLKQSLVLYGDWLVKNQTERGDFNYELDVQSGEVSDSYNIVREAGGLYSLCHAYKYTSDCEYQLSIEKGITFFETLFEEVENTVPTTRINYLDERKSNAVAIFLLALVEYMETDSDIKSKYLNMSKELANYLLYTQLESGGFLVTLDPKTESDYNNGEAFLALIRMYKVTGDERYLQGAQRAADYIISKYSKEEFNSAIYSWAMQGFAHLFTVDANPKYWDFMKFYTDSYFNSSGLYVSKYFEKEYANPPRASLAVFLEGLSSVAWIAKETDSDYYSQIMEYTERSLGYLMTLQINGPKSLKTSEFELLSGGICNDELCTKQRVDTTQHNLSAIYLYLQYAR